VEGFTVVIRIKGEDAGPFPALRAAQQGKKAGAKVAPVRKSLAVKEAAREVRRDVAADEAEVSNGVMPKRIILTMPEGLTKRLDVEWHRRGLHSRAETIRALLEEALKP
jgi:hypothetical protein